MSKMLLKRAAAIGAAFIAIGSAGALSLSSVAGAATIHPAVSQSAHAAARSASAVKVCKGVNGKHNLHGPGCPE